MRYQPFYCEENVWQLAHQRRDEPGERFVVFISNPTKSCALWAQKAAPSPAQPVIWDYHVILIERTKGQVQVLDLDTTLGMPLLLQDYLARTFATPPGLPEHMRAQIAPHFRVVPAARFLACFASDRSHMLTEDGYQQPPPPWPCIQTNGAQMNLMRFVDVEAPFEGELFELGSLRDHFEL